MRKKVSGYINVVTEGKSLSEFVQSERFPVDIKDCKTGRYVANNEAAAVVSRLNAKERLGLNIYDIGALNGLTASAIEKVIYADQSVSPDHSPVSLMHVFVDKDKETIAVDKVVKKAVMNRSNHMTSILSYAQDIAPYIDRSLLYTFYKSYYTTTAAIQKFLHYLNLTGCFLTLPTEQELSVLLTGHELKETESISQEVKMPLLEVKNYQAQINNKLTIIEYDEIIMRLNAPATFYEADHSI